MADLRGKIALVTGGAYKTGDLAVSAASPVLTERNHRRSASGRILAQRRGCAKRRIGV